MIIVANRDQNHKNGYVFSETFYYLLEWVLENHREHGVGLLSSRARSAPLVWGNDPEVDSEAPQQNRT
ncbi:MAG: hypothetical protein C5S48_04045 [Candidatus Methanogaster sp.]|nr:MAG: hypothetical protein C5S48_04045 [ANME-2 cluster archaeon]